jgi:hypothetical protein
MTLPLPCPNSVLMQTILRGTILPGEEEQIADHLEECDQCRRAFAILSDVEDDDC